MSNVENTKTKCEHEYIQREIVDSDYMLQCKNCKAVEFVNARSFYSSTVSYNKFKTIRDSPHSNK